MRNFLILIVSLLAPYALYASGCNQNPQAAFPTTPEMRALARAPETAGRAPFIPAPAIDREILASAHDASTRSRVQAAQDRSNVFAMAAPAAGLFVLPAEQVGSGAPYAAAPMPSAREFWSRPVAAAPQSRPPQAQPRFASPPDVYAMAPAGQPFPEAVPVLPALGFEPLPEPITLGPAIPTAGFYAQQQFPAQNLAPPSPLPSSGPAMQPRPALPSAPGTPYPLRPGEKLLPPESVPGLFLGADAAGAVTARQPLAAGPGRENAVRSEPSAPPPLLSLSPPGLPPPSSPAQSSAPQHRASRRLEALLQNTDAAPVLAPLPRVAGKTSVSGKANPVGKAAALSRPVPAAVSLRPSAQAGIGETTAVNAAPVKVQPLPLAPPAGLIAPPPAVAAATVSPSAAPTPSAAPVTPTAPIVPAADLHDFFRTDFWAAKTSPASAPALRPQPANEQPLAEVTPGAAKPAEIPASVPFLPPIPAASGLKPPEDFARDWDVSPPAVKPQSGAADLEVPTRVTLKPVRKKQDFQAIDAGVDVAPMNF